MEVREGEGWRLEHDPARHPFVVLIGGGAEQVGGWAAELTTAEARALRCGVIRLVEQHGALVATLMDEEALDLELEVPCESGALWLGLSGDRSGWRLRFVLSPGAGQRALEGFWDRAASAAVAAALRALPFGDAPAAWPDSG